MTSATATATFGAAQVAAAFLAQVKGGASWPAQFTAWAACQGLTDAEARAVRVVILRARVFGALTRGAAR